MKENQLSLYIKDINRKRLLTLFRGEKELNFLYDWIKKKQHPPKEDEFDNLTVRETIEKCSLCSDIKEKRFGSGDGQSGVMIILITPGAIDEIEKKSMEGESADLFKKMLKSIDLNLKDCYATNLIKCRASNLLNKPSLMFNNCERILEKEMQTLMPKIIIVMGDSLPLRNIMNKNSGIVWKSIDHPMTLLKHPERKREAWETLKQVKAKLT